MLRSAASPGSRGVRPVGRRYEWPPHDTATDRPPPSALLRGLAHLAATKPHRDHDGARSGAFFARRVRACPAKSLPSGLTRGWKPVLGKGHAQTKQWRGMTIRRKVIPLYLFDLTFAKLDMLLGDRIVFLLHQLVGHGARVLSGDIIETRIRAGDQLY